ncbi:MAG: right-handed parallel beta-helix repeat-containing protein [Ruminococcus sp.]|nr:right-handed parallel beta-helix repeat-containing protein [Ruminococcus sp.]
MNLIKKISSFIIASLLVSALNINNMADAFIIDNINGDVNADGEVTVADAIMMQNFLVGNGSLIDWKAGDFNSDDRIDVFDFCILRDKIAPQSKNSVYVKDTEELKSALANAQAGDEIILAEGEYIYSGSTPKGHMFTGEADGTETKPIIIRSENPANPSVISGITVNKNYALTITGDWWEVRNIKVTNASKGIILDNSNHTKLINCEVYNTGAEGIHFRDNSSYCLADSCLIYDTGVISPGYGEGIYVGSAKSTTGYGYNCDYNTISGCIFGAGITAEHIDIKEYTTGTVIENCIFNGMGISGEHYSKSFVNIKGNDCIIRNCTGYRNGCEKITRAFESNQVVDGWGQNTQVYGNKVYMDTAVNVNGGKMYFLNAWDCTATVWDNYMAYEDGKLFSIDNEDDHWNYYNCDKLTYGGK